MGIKRGGHSADEVYRRIWGVSRPADPLPLEALEESRPAEPATAGLAAKPKPQAPRRPAAAFTDSGQGAGDSAPDATAEAVLAQLRPPLVSLLARMTSLEASQVSLVALVEELSRRLAASGR